MPFLHRKLLLLLALPTGCALAQVVNMSHDLVTLGIANQNMIPNSPSLDSAPLFTAAANYVKSHAVQTLTLDPGSYYLLSAPPAAFGADVLFYLVSNLTIDLAGSTFYLLGPQVGAGIVLDYCTNVTLRNFHLDYLNPPFTQVQVASVDAVNRIVTYQDLPGWPDPSSFNNLIAVGGVPATPWTAFFRNGAIVPGTTRMQVQLAFTNNHIVITDPLPWSQSATLATIMPGDTAVVTVRGGGPELQVWEGNGITLSDISIYASSEEAIELFQTTNSILRNVNLVRRPNSSNLIAAAGDGFNFHNPVQNDHILHCYVERTMDDGLVFGDTYAAIVVSQPAPQQLVVTRDAYFRFPNGTPMNFVDPATTLESPGATIVSQSPPDVPGVAYYGQVTLTFDSNLPTNIAPGTIMVFGSSATRGGNSTIEDSTVIDTYSGRGIWITSGEDMTIQRNVVARTGMAGITVRQITSAAADPEDDSAPAHNITIQNNALEGILGPAPCGTGNQDCLGALVVVSLDNHAGLATSAGNTNIVVQNNYVADSGKSGIFFGEVNGGTMQNNLVIRSSQNPALSGTFGFGPPDSTLVAQYALEAIVMPFSTSVMETGDTVSSTSPISAPVTFNPPGTTAAAGIAAGSFAVQTAVNGFGWQAFSDSPWLAVDSMLPDAGNGAVQFSLAANTTGAARTGHITIAGEMFTLTQTTAVSDACNVTGDQTTSLADLLMVINEALGTAPPTQDPNGDGVVNVLDIQKVINALYGLGC